VAQPPDTSLASILKFVRASLKGRGNFGFDSFVDGLWRELEKVGMPGVIRTSPLQGYTGSVYNFNSADGRLRHVIYCVTQTIMISGHHPPRNL
jgi:hypothetical protein